MEIIARKKECGILERLYASERSEFLAIYGRRRIGKTFLIRNFFLQKECVYFELSGQKKENGEPATVDHQIGNFQHAWRRAFGRELPKPKNWDDAFYALKEQVEALTSRKTVVVLFFDELPWLCTKNSGFYENLDQAWNASFDRAQHVKMIVCGSASSWILKKIVYAKAGLSRRITQKIRLEPFNLTEVKEYLFKNKFDVSYESIIELYMISGGVPYYLDFLIPEKSLYENIDEQFFSRDGHLHDEYDIIFDSLFSNSGSYKKIMEILAQNRHGCTLEEIQQRFDPDTHSPGGLLVTILTNLYECGFITKRIPLYNRRKGVVYSLIDEFVLFYLKWMKDRTPPAGPCYTFRNTIAVSPSYRIWQGFSFEMLCLKHEYGIKRALGIDRIASESGFFYAYDQHSRKRTAQIDLLFDRSDKSISLCEIKHYTTEYEINKQDADALKRKRDELLKHLSKKRKPQKNILYAFITMHGLKRNKYYNELQPVSVVADDLFMES